MMSKEERDNVAAMVRGLEPLPRALSVALSALVMTGLFFALYAIVSTVRGKGFTAFTPEGVWPSILLLLGVSMLVRHRLDRLALKVTGQYNEATLSRGKLRVELGIKDRVKQFIPTLISWKGLLLLWLVANALDCVSTFVALHYGAQEANPAAREASNMYLSKWIAVIVLTAMALFWQWKNPLKLLTVTMWLVALSNFAVLGMHIVQPNLANADYPDVSMPAFLIQLVETAVVAVVILWGREMWSKVSIFYKKHFRRQNAVY
jgi:hypothetical protein